MSENETQIEADLRLLGERLRQGLAKRHPVSARSLKTVQDIVRQQWQEEQERQAAGGKTKPQQEKSAQTEEKSATKADTKPKKQDKDWGHGY